ncbi:MAG: hypothetical protein P8L31_05060 [Pseudomonadales bacterium]|nr:hypothetical protein [Pseudomonadales bacterium]
MAIPSDASVHLISVVRMIGVSWLVRTWLSSAPEFCDVSLDFAEAEKEVRHLITDAPD